MIRERLPRATIITFWHIPWPNPEAFGICPWREELLEGMLGSSILGFHTQFHCNNFLDTVDRFLEARVDRETSRASPTAAIRPLCAAIRSRSSGRPRRSPRQPPVAECRRARARAPRPAPRRALGVGVDRLDYTKGIQERFAAIERLLEREPRWIGQFSFVQAAAPTAHLDRRVPASSTSESTRGGGAHQRALRPARAAPRSCCAASTTSRRGVPS